MKRLKTFWMAMLLGLLLMATLVGIATATPNATPEARRPWRVITVATQACSAENDTHSFRHWQQYLTCQHTLCVFVCPVYFPAAGEQAAGAVTVKRVTMYAYDNSYDMEAYFYLHKTHPQNGTYVTMAFDQTWDSPADPQTVVDTTIASPVVYRTRAPYLWVVIDDEIKVYGFHIHYTW